MGPSVEWDIDNLFKWLCTIEQDGHHAHIKTLKNLFLQTQESFEAESWYIASGTEGLPSLFHEILRWPETVL